MNEFASTKLRQRNGKANVRLLILVVLLLLVGAAFMYDKYVLLPSAEEKINKVINEVTLSLNDDNRKDVDSIVGVTPAKEFQHKGLTVVQYRFPRGLPFYPRPVLDVAYKGGAIVYAESSELTPEILDSRQTTSQIKELDRENREIGVIAGMGGQQLPPASDQKKDDEEVEEKPDSNDDSADDSGDADQDSDGDSRP